MGERLGVPIALVSYLMAFEYAGWQIVAILATYVFAAVAKGITGLGFSTTCLPFLAFIVGLKEAMPLVIIPSISSNLVVMYSAGQLPQTLRRFWPMLAATVPGLALGLWILSWIDGQQAGGVLGGMLLLWCGYSFANPSLRLAPFWARCLAPVSGFLTGVVNGLTGSQVVPSVPYLTLLHLERNMFITAVNCSFTVSSVIMAIGLAQLGLFSSNAVVMSALGTGVIFFGLRIGEKVRNRLSPDRFRFAVLLMLVLMGVGLLVQAM